MSQEDSKDKIDNTWPILIGLAIVGGAAGYAFGGRFLLRDAKRLARTTSGEYSKVRPQSTQTEQELQEVRRRAASAGMMGLHEKPKERAQAADHLKSEVAGKGEPKSGGEKEKDSEGVWGATNPMRKE